MKSFESLPWSNIDGLGFGWIRFFVSSIDTSLSCQYNIASGRLGLRKSLTKISRVWAYNPIQEQNWVKADGRVPSSQKSVIAVHHGAVITIKILIFPPYIQRTAFQQQAWNVLRQIKPGQTLSVTLKLLKGSTSSMLCVL